MIETAQQNARLQEVLVEWAAGDALLGAVAATVGALAAAAVDLGGELVAAAMAGGQDEAVGVNPSGDVQRALDERAHRLLVEALRGSPVALVASEEEADPIPLRRGAPLVVAVDPLDGSGNLAINGPMGLIFSIRPSTGDREAFLRPGTEQLAAGFVLYGPATILVLSTGAGTDLYVLDPATGAFVRTVRGVRLPQGTPAYSVNASNARHWSPEFRAYIADLEAGTEGLRGRDFNMRWYGALVIEAFQILVRGGIYLYPADRRPAYRSGCIRLLYEAHPIAMLMEQAGGSASDGRQPIMTLVPAELHQRTPLVFGSADKVARVGRYLQDLTYDAERAPLFATRGLFRD